jgi:hypothetical protein
MEMAISLAWVFNETINWAESSISPQNSPIRWF